MTVGAQGNVAIKHIFSLLLISLQLQDTVPRPSVFHKPFPYSFPVKAAIAKLCELKSEAIIPRFYLQIPDRITAHFASKLITKFLQAHLLHCPMERSIQPVRPNLELQPTAKGLAILQQFCQVFGLASPYVNKLLTSTYNSMSLLHLERDPKSGEALISDGALLVIWSKMMGHEANVYDVASMPKPVSAPQLSDITGQTEFPTTPTAAYFSKPASGISPYFHKHFTHPSSNASSQYFSVTEGVRLFKDLTLETKVKGRAVRQVVNYLVSGKSLWQWLMDCTDITSSSEAVYVVSLLVENNFVAKIAERVVDTVSCPDKMPKLVSRETFYRLTLRGLRYCDWEVLDHEAKDNFEEWDWERSGGSRALAEEQFRNSINISTVLAEPGLKMLFRTYLNSKNTNELLNFHDSVLSFRAQYQALLSLAMQQDTRMVIVSISACLSILNGISSRFLMPESPQGLNVDNASAQQFDNELNLLRMESNGDIKQLESLNNMASALARIDSVVLQDMANSIPGFLTACTDLEKLRFPQYIQMSQYSKAPHLDVVTLPASCSHPAAKLKASSP